VYNFEKAFDGIQKEILLDILKSRNIPNTLLKAIVNKNTQHKTLIKFNNKLSKLAEINKAVRQGCPFSPTLFNIYLDEIITKWKKDDIKGIPLSKISNC
jgi:ubiquinone biosynthesis protein Coq4